MATPHASPAVSPIGSAARRSRLARFADRLRPTAVGAGLLAALATAAPAAAQMRVMTWNIAQLNGDTTALRETIAHVAGDDVPGFALAPHVIILQEVNNGDQTALLSLAQQAVPSANYQLATFTNGGESGGAQALLYRGDSLVEITAGHRDLFTGAGRDADRWLLRWLEADPGEGSFYVYGAHLKASQGSSNEQQRLTGANTLRDDMDGLPADANFLLGGDLNLYSNTEPAFDALLDPSGNPLFDPLGGTSWAGAANSIKHTQSPRGGSSGVLIGGGLDDRFDFVLPSVTLDDAAGLAFMPGTYRSVGNDGNHFDGSINAGNNFYFPGDLARSNNLADDLFEASDHIPVVVEFMVPPVMTVDLPADLGRIIQGAGFIAPITIENTAAALVPEATSPLFVSYFGSGALIGSGVALDNPLGGPTPIFVAVNTAAAGIFPATLDVVTEDEGVLDPSRQLVSQVTIVRPADPSLDAGSTVLDGEFAVTSPPDAGVLAVDVPIFNRNWDALQARLDVDGVSDLGVDLSLAGPLAGDIETSTTVPLAFDTTGRAAGDYETTISVTVSDEDLPGEATTELTVLVRVTIDGGGGPVEDLSGDGSVGFDDLVLLLSTFGQCPGGGSPCPADFDGNGSVDFGDLVQLLSVWG